MKEVSISVHVPDEMPNVAGKFLVIVAAMNLYEVKRVEVNADGDTLFTFTNGKSMSIPAEDCPSPCNPDECAICEDRPTCSRATNEAGQVVRGKPNGC